MPFDKSQMEIDQNNEFRVKPARGELGFIPADAFWQRYISEGLERDVDDLRLIQEQVHEITIRLGTMEAL